MLENREKTGSTCNYTAIGSNKLNKKLRTTVVSIGVVILASATCSMFCKLVAVVIFMQMCAKEHFFTARYYTETH